MAKSSKGSAYERELCRYLSLWWSDGRRDDCFWRTSNSGGRATARSRKGQSTSGHYGDICATDEEGKPLLSQITFELKRGYSRCTIADLLDKGVKAKRQQYEEWFSKLKDTAEQARTNWWALVHRRDQRQAMIFIPFDLHTHLVTRSGRDVDLKIELSDNRGLLEVDWVVGCTLDSFFSAWSAAHLKYTNGVST